MNQLLLGRYTGEPLRFHYTTLQQQYPTSLSLIEAIAILVNTLANPSGIHFTDTSDSIPAAHIGATNPFTV